MVEETVDFPLFVRLSTVFKGKFLYFEILSWFGVFFHFSLFLLACSFFALISLLLICGLVFCFLYCIFFPLHHFSFSPSYIVLFAHISQRYLIPATKNRVYSNLTHERNHTFFWTLRERRGSDFSDCH